MRYRVRPAARLTLNLALHRGEREGGGVELVDYLSIPYLIAVHSAVSDEGEWLRFAECPELPGCHAEAVSITDALDGLDRKRVEIIVDLLRAGRTPPVPRPPLRNDDPLPDLRLRGLLDDFPELADLADLGVARVV